MYHARIDATTRSYTLQGVQTEVRIFLMVQKCPNIPQFETTVVHMKNQGNHGSIYCALVAGDKDTTRPRPYAGAPRAPSSQTYLLDVGCNSLGRRKERLREKTHERNTRKFQARRKENHQMKKRPVPVNGKSWPLSRKKLRGAIASTHIAYGLGGTVITDTSSRLHFGNGLTAPSA